LTELIELALLARLPQAIEVLVRELDARAASSSDVRVQMEALGPLARVVRYGDVRETKSEHVRPVLKTLFERVVVGCLPACTQLDDDAASALVAAIGTAHAACLLLDEPELKRDWLGALSGLTRVEAVHPRIRGRACRLLLEQRVLEPAALLALASLALSASVEPARAAQWIEGLVEGEGLLLLHQTELLQALDTWLRGLGDELFRAQLPLLRRAFSSLSPAERRGFAQQVKSADPAGVPLLSVGEGLDRARAERVLPVLAHILGVEHG
jgi:hypothetical protein